MTRTGPGYWTVPARSAGSTLRPWTSPGSEPWFGQTPGRRQAVLARPDTGTRRRPDRWSALEYACHVRDVFGVYLRRLDRMLTEEGPHYDNWDQDATAVAERYGRQSPASVAAELTAAAAALADRFDTVGGDQLHRTGFRNDGAAFTIDTFARYFIHDPVHHLWDVGAHQAS